MNDLTHLSLFSGIGGLDIAAERAGQITGMEIKPVHEEEMRQARLENEAAGIYFPPDDPDKW